jgi:hypothetical protein
MGGHKQPARIKTGRSWILAKYILAYAALAPALYVNPGWLGDASLDWKLVAAAGIVFAAVFIDGVRWVRPWYAALVVFGIGVFFCYVNTLVAMDNASHASERDTHARKTHNLAAKTASSQSSQSSQKRAALVALAGETPSATYEADIQAAIAKDIGRWNATGQCRDITAKASGTFCAGIATLQGKKTAAVEREKLDEESAKAPKAKVERSVDPFADTFPVFAAGFGIKVEKEMARPHITGVRSIQLELIAAFGPMTLLAIMDGVALAGAAMARAPLEPRGLPAPTPAVSEPQQAVPAAPEVPVPTLTEFRRQAKAKAEAEAKVQRLHDMFVADHLEDCNGVSMPTGEPFEMWKRFCAARGVQPGSQKAFTQRLAHNFTHDPNGGRPRFLNVKAKGRPKLALVSTAQA